LHAIQRPCRPAGRHPQRPANFIRNRVQARAAAWPHRVSTLVLRHRPYPRHATDPSAIPPRVLSASVVRLCDPPVPSKFPANFIRNRVQARAAAWPHRVSTLVLRHRPYPRHATDPSAIPPRVLSASVVRLCDPPVPSKFPGKNRNKQALGERLPEQGTRLEIGLERRRGDACD
jgi:hypothetical protein